MSLSDNTKRLLAETLEEMMRHRSLRDIRIQEVCEAAGVTRQTFYYHFKDKYDLVAWIYLQDQLRAYQETVGDGVLYSETVEPGVYAAQMRRQLELIQERRAFYRNALKEENQNSLIESMLDNTVGSSFKELQDILGTKDLSRPLQDAVRFYYYGMNSLIRDWILGDLDRSIDELVEYHVDMMPKIMSIAYIKGKDIGA